MSKVEIGFGGKLNASFQSTVEKVKAGVRETVAETKKIAVETTKAEVKHTALHAAMSASFSVLSFAARRSLSTILPTVASILGGFSLLVGSTKILSGTMWLLERATGAVNTGLSKFAMTEDLATKLRPITGSVDAAKSKLRELAEMIKGTGISLPDAVSTYRTTKVQTGGALSDRQGMTMLGDVAAGSGNGINETSEAVSKLYGDLHSGQPVEEATGKLREMGIISSDVQKQISTLAAEGKSGAEIWNMLTREFQKSSGAMAEARDNLTSLQAGLAQAKDTLYSLFAEDSADEAKDSLKAKTKVLEDLQPAAKEAGSLFAALKSVWGDTTTQLNKFYDSVLQNVGGLKTWVDVLFVAGAGVVGFAAGVPLAAAALGTLAVGALAAGGVIVAAVAVIAGGLFVWAHHMNEANEKQLALMRGNDAVATELRKQGNEIKTVTDKALALAAAYEQLRKAKEALGNAKTGKEKDEERFQVQRIEAEIRSIEKKDDAKLKPGAAREKSEKDLKDAQAANDELTNNPTEKNDAAQSTLTDARSKQAELQGKLDALTKSFQPGGEESDKSLDDKIAKAQTLAKASRLKESGFRSEAKETPAGEGGDFSARDGLLAAAEKEKQVQAAQQQQINAFLAQKAGRTQRTENAHADLAAQDVVVKQAENDAFKTQRADESYKARLAELDAEKSIAGLKTEGLQHAREEWAVKKAMLSAEMKTATDNGDKTKQGEVGLQMAQGDAALRKQEQTAVVTQRELDAERQIAALQGEGLERLTKENDIRLGLIEARWKEANAAKDTLEAERQRTAYYAQQVRHGKDVENLQEREKERVLQLASAQQDRQGNYDKRLADAALETGKITPEQRRALQIDELRKKQRQAYDEAAKMEDEAKKEQQLGHEEKAGKLSTEAVRKRTEGDTLGFDAYELFHKPDTQRPVADNLRKLGLGGDVGANPKDPLLAQGEKAGRTLEAVLTVLKEIKDQKNAPTKPGTFAR